MDTHDIGETKSGQVPVAEGTKAALVHVESWRVRSKGISFLPILPPEIIQEIALSHLHKWFPDFTIACALRSTCRALRDKLLMERIVTIFVRHIHFINSSVTRMTIHL